MSILRGKAACLSSGGKLLKFRRENSDLFIQGGFEFLGKENEKTFPLKKRERSQNQGRTALVVLNFPSDRANLPVPEGLEIVKV